MSKLVIFSGLPGTGKSTLSEKLAREFGWPLLCIDDFIGEMPENAGFSFWDSRIAMLMDVIETQLKIGLNVIVDSVFMNTDRHHAQALARKYKARFLPVHVFVSDENIWRERVDMRLRNSNYEDTADWEQITHQRTHFRAWEPGTALFIDSINPLDKNFAAVLDFVQAETVELKPMKAVPLETGRYHE
jgi:predicted kinase